MPTPTMIETKEEFLRRGMADLEARRDFPDREQRYAFLQSQWDERRKGFVGRLFSGESVSVLAASNSPLLAGTKEEARPLLVKRPVLNADEVIEWAKGQGFETTLPPEDLHVTVMFSKTPVRWDELGRGDVMSKVSLDSQGGPRSVERLGAEGALVLRFEEPRLRARWKALVDGGATWGHDDYLPHVTLSYQAGEVDPATVQPFTGVLRFGPEQWQEARSDWHERITEKLIQKLIPIEKVDDERRVAYGWASVIEEDDEEVVDYDREVITEDDLVTYAHHFKLGNYGGKAMHAGERVSELVESLVFTKDVQQALGIDLGKVGWWVGFKYEPVTWARIKSGELPMFSLAGKAVPRRR